MSAVYVTISRQGEVCGRCSGNGCSSCGGKGEVGVDIAEWDCKECGAQGYEHVEGRITLCAGLERCEACGCDDVRIIDESPDEPDPDPFDDDDGSDLGGWYDDPAWRGSRCEP